MRLLPIACPFVLASLFSITAVATPLRNGFELSVNVAPTPVRSASSWRLAYEVQLTNHADVALTLERIDVLDEHVRTLATTAEPEALLRLAGATRDEKPTRVVPAGRHAVIYLDVLQRADQPLPKSLTHRLVFRRPNEEPTNVEGAAVRIATRPAIVIGAPLRDGDWIALYDPAMARGHRRVAFAFDGTWRIPARFAIDWMRIDEHGALAHGDEQSLDHWLGYGADVLAVADAKVVALRDSIAEPARLGDTTAHPLEDASGNYVSLDLGNGRYVHYEHLKPGSVRVKVGQRVKRGDVLAALGYTGDSTGPHLHMHVSDGDRPLAGEGLPFEIDAFDQLGQYASMSDVGTGKRWTDATPDQRARRKALPEPAAVVRFKDSAP
jgi:hypothetical protein